MIQDFSTLKDRHVRTEALSEGQGSLCAIITVSLKEFHFSSDRCAALYCTIVVLAQGAIRG